MPDEINEILNKVKKLGLSRREKNLIKDQILKFMAEHPVRDEALERQHYQRSFNLFGLKNMPIVAIIAILALLGGGTSFAAQGTLPGDALYPVKVHVNEAVQEFLAWSPQAKAQIEANLAELRLEEAEKLAAQGKLNAAAQSEIESNFEAHANAADNLVKQLAARNDLSSAAEVGSELESSLKAHGRILANLGASSTVRKIDSEIEDSQGENADVEDNLASSTAPEVERAAQKKLAEVQNKISEVSDFVSANSGKVSSSTLAEAQAALAAANGLIAQGQAKLQAGDYGAAFVLFQQAQLKAQDAKLMVNAEDEFKVEIRGPEIEMEGVGERQEVASGTRFEGDENSGVELRVRGGVNINASGTIENENSSGDEHGGVKIEL